MQTAFPIPIPKPTDKRPFERGDQFAVVLCGDPVPMYVQDHGDPDEAWSIAQTLVERLRRTRDPNAHLILPDGSRWPADVEST